MKEILRIEHAVIENQGNGSLNDYNLAVFEKDILYIQGTDESGLHTLMQVLAGDLVMSSGRLYFNEKPVTDYNRNTALRYYTYPITAGLDLVDNMTIRDNLEGVRRVPFAGQIYKRGHLDEQITKYWKSKDGFPETNKLVRELSSGEKKHLSILKAKIHGAKLIVLDTTQNLYEGRMVEEICRFIQDLNKEGISFVILSDRYTLFAEMATRIQIMMQGKDKKEWYGINDQVRARLRYQQQKIKSEKYQIKSDIATDRLFTGLFDYEWEGQKSIWAYLREFGTYNAQIWDRYIGADIPREGAGMVKKTVVIPRGSEDMLLNGLSLGDNLIITIPEKASFYKSGIIQKRIKKNLLSTFLQKVGANEQVMRVEQLNRVQRKILSIYRYVLKKPQFIILESPYSGMKQEECQLLRVYMQELQERGIHIFYFAKTVDEILEDCSLIIRSENGRSAIIYTE